MEVLPKRNERKQATERLSVSILTEDISDAKKLSEALREFGIFAHFFQDLNEFWVSLNNSLPDLCIVDIKKMSQGTLIFKNHPRVISDSLNTIFFYNQEDSFLLNSTFHLTNLGYIRKEVNLTGQIESILNRFTKTTNLEDKNVQLQGRIQRLQKRSTKLVTDINESVQFHQRLTTLEEIVECFEQNIKKFDFNAIVAQVFADWDSVIKFGMYELNQSGQKLVSPKFNRKKFFNFPQLWLGRSSERGIETFAHDMATQVAIDQMGANMRTLKISGRYDAADLLIFIESNEEALESFNWRLFEQLLSGVYRKAALRATENMAQNRMISPWESMGLQDEIYYHQRTNEVQLVNISFNNLVQQIKLKFNNRFYWKAFFKDFLFQLDQQLDEGTFYSEQSVHQLLVFCEKENFEVQLAKLNNFVKAFSFWKYFEDSSIVLTANSIPSVKLVSASSINYLRHMDAEFDDMETPVSKASKRASEILSSKEL
jgi:hypothetical protein